MDQSAHDSQDSVSEGGDAADAEEPAFSAVLTPHRSLGPRGFLLLMTAVALASFTTGLVFLLAGAWPVIAFLAADVLLIYWAFRLSYRSGRVYETVAITRNRLTVTRVSPSGRAKSWEFNPYWVRCQLLKHAGRADQLSLTSHGRRLIFGSFLSPDERREFAVVLSGALREARGGDRI